MKIVYKDRQITEIEFKFNKIKPIKIEYYKKNIYYNAPKLVIIGRKNNNIENTIWTYMYTIDRSTRCGMNQVVLLQNIINHSRVSSQISCFHIDRMTLFISLLGLFLYFSSRFFLFVLFGWCIMIIIKMMKMYDDTHLSKIICIAVACAESGKKTPNNIYPLTPDHFLWAFTCLLSDLSIPIYFKDYDKYVSATTDLKLCFLWTLNSN